MGWLRSVLVLLLVANQLAIYGAEGQCLDFHQFCQFWQSIGECQSNPGWMDGNCRQSCGTCNGRRNFDDTTPLMPDRLRNKNDVSHCSRIPQYQAARVLPKEGLVIPVEDVSGERRVTLNEVQRRKTEFGCARMQNVLIDCRRNMCYHKRYRAMDGTCNNFRRPLRGAAFMPLKRLRPPIYDDGHDAPVGSFRRRIVSPRDVSRFILRSDEAFSNNNLNTLLMQFGQFLSHDIVKTTILPNEKCRNCRVPPTSSCLSIEVNATDPGAETFGCQKGPTGALCCVRTARSCPICGSGQGFTQKREQYNENTAYIDGSQIYGSSVEDSLKLRKGRTGFMKVGQINNRPHPPFNPNECTNNQECKINFEAGDDRANLFVGLATLHTIFLREHNRIAGELHRINPHWDGDRVYHEARKIVGAEIQIIAFEEYLPRILGRDAMGRTIGPYFGYNSDVDPSIANVFATGAYRFGHGMVRSFFKRRRSDGAEVPGFNFVDGVFHSERIKMEGGIDPIILGMLTTPVKRPFTINPQMTEEIFGNMDLAAVNIERGREHGLPGYDSWRAFCNLPHARTFDHLSSEISNRTALKLLEENYQFIHNVDLYVAQLLEDNLPGAMVGPTVACLVGEQFKRLRDGDRFFYKNQGIFTNSQLAELEKVKLSRILCDNGDDINRAPMDTFRFTDFAFFTTCELIPRIALEKWKE